MGSRGRHILFADDDENSRFLLGRQLAASLGVYGSVRMVADGESVIEYLRGNGEFADREHFPFPSLLITDLKMPRIDGFGVLDLMRRNPDWALLPRIVFTCSNDPDDIRTAYALGASAFHQKPSGIEATRAAIGLIVAYWLSCDIPQLDRQGRVVESSHRGKLGEPYLLPVAVDGTRAGIPIP